ncbi:hypothetical protein ES288_A08G266700v1 [Gossypium darwinii]|uniref:TF-B3 domain-containing protein n=1 Tax=Gossypium darwinii TaxID=34276 RepID=A0A5D2FTB9_GOSDA|nr:hypothetical protein ES288_A08G266700v1 [Gossypium darwinii]
MFTSSMNHPKTLHFFRIILSQTQKLPLPKRFVSLYGDDLSNTVIVKAPTGPEWKVELMKCDGEIWLANGWKDFADYFSLKYGNLLIFRYEGHSRFYVFMIFDQTTLEIEYPNGIDNHEVELQIPDVEEVGSEDVVEIVNNVLRSRKTTEKTRSSPRKRTRMQGATNAKKSEFRMSSRDGSKIGPEQAGGGTSAAQRSSASSANHFGSEQPFFVVNIQPSYMTAFRANVPFTFARTYFTWKEADVVLKDRDGRTWPIHLKVYNKYHCTSFGRGWKAFAIDNDLRVGDSCAFELLEGPEISFRVTVFRNPEDSNDRHTSTRGSKIGHGRHKRELNARIQIEYDHSSENETIRYSKRNKESHVPRRKIKNGDGKFDEAMQNKTSARRAIQRLPRKGTAIARALERVSKLRLAHPLFKVIITTNFLQRGFPSIPERFCDEHMEQIPEDVTLKYKHKSWRVRMIICSDRAGRFSIGWRAFVQGNKLKVGDVCVFKMIKKTNIVFEVSIFRDGLTLG